MEFQPKRLLKGNVNLLEQARELRKNATKQENHLWYDFLKNRPEQWYRQRIIGSFIVDFYCPRSMLVVELDGMHHIAPQQKAYDEERSAYLTSLGLFVLRFQNREVDNHFNMVCDHIAAVSTLRLQTPRLLPVEVSVQVPLQGTCGLGRLRKVSRSDASLCASMTVLKNYTHLIDWR